VKTSKKKQKKLNNIGPETMWSIYEQFETRFWVEERTRDCCNILGWLINSGDMPIEHGDSWFSAKIITVMHPLKNLIR